MIRMTPYRAHARRIAIVASLALAAACGRNEEPASEFSGPAPQGAETPAPAAAPASETAEVETTAPAAAMQPASTPVPPSDGDDGELVEVMLCDGETTTTASTGDNSPENGKRIADDLMAQWKRKNPDMTWIDDELEKHKVAEPADNSGLVGDGQGATYGKISEADVKLWEHETYKMAVEGSTIFHSGDLLGSTISVSCDMCHPDAANTHPETYPKFQDQLGRVALLRDMINWCIEHPVRGEKLDPDSPQMRALEAYIIAQRTGEPLQYGKR